MGIAIDLEKLTNSKSVRFTVAIKIAEKYFGKPRITGSHHIFKMPWQGDPRINMQSGKGSSAKPYQIKILVKALKKLEELSNE